MAQNRRTTYDKPRPGGLGNGVYLATVVSHLDPTLMGSLKVTLLKHQANVTGDDSQSYIVRAAPPYWGTSSFEFMGYNNADFNDTQKSYGMWFVPPDVGVTVMCVFIDGDPGQGYWIGCVPSRFANHMVPGYAATDKVEHDTTSEGIFGSTPLPTGEINRRYNSQDQQTDPEKIKKPIHPIAYRFLTQGLVEDDVRGTTTASARRQVPSSVFGISTPGPLDKSPGAKRNKIGTIQSPTEAGVPVSRLGGTQFVMDDGDPRYMRSGTAGTVAYAEAYADGKATDSFNIPKDEHFRIRTRTGHQILMHNSEDLIYIGNSRGTTWIELTSNGKIDIFAEDSVSVHTKNDMNFRADRDINMEAGRNINIKTTAEYQADDPEFRYNNDADIVDFNGYENGRIQIESAENFNLLIGRNGKIQCRNDNAENGHLEVKVMGDMKIAVRDPDTGDGVAPPEVTDTAPPPEGVKGLHIYSYENTLIKTDKNLDLHTLGNNAYTAGGTTDILSGGNHTETAPQIHMNGPAARSAEIAEVSTAVKVLPTHELPITERTLIWQDTKYQYDETLMSIMKRVPMHEPWTEHENLKPLDVLSPGTDREVSDTGEG